MFQTALAAAAVGTATDASVAAVAEFLLFAVSSLGLGVTAASVASAGAPTEVGDNVTAWTSTFTVNGKNAKVVFAAAAASFPAGAKNYYGATQSDGPDALTVVGDSATDPWTENAFTPAATLWTATVSIDGDDGDTTVDADEVVAVYTKLVK